MTVTGVISVGGLVVGGTGAGAVHLIAKTEPENRTQESEGHDVVAQKEEAGEFHIEEVSPEEKEKLTATFPTDRAGHGGGAQEAGSVSVIENSSSLFCNRTNPSTAPDLLQERQRSAPSIISAV